MLDIMKRFFQATSTVSKNSQFHCTSRDKLKVNFVDKKLSEAGRVYIERLDNL